MRRGSVFLAALVAIVAGCASAPSSVPPSPVRTPIATATAPATSAPTPVVTVEPTLAPPSGFARYPGGTILFTRTDDAREHDTSFEIAPDGSGETQLDADYGHGAWSPDGRTLAFAWGIWEQGLRPALLDSDGGNFRVLDPGRPFAGHLFPLGWSADGTRLFMTTGGHDVTNKEQLGLYSMDATSGGDLQVIIATPADHGDLYAISPDGRHVLITRVMLDDSNRVLLVANIDGTDLRQLSPPDGATTMIDFDWWDDASEGWAPDGKRVAFNAHDEASNGPGRLFVAGLGGDAMEIVGEATGGVTARWSPDGEWIAFTSKFRTGAQIWRVRPDGSDLEQLTLPATGFSVMPVWSPDSAHLLFQRQVVDAGEVTLWTMQANGSDQRQLSATPLASDLVGGYAWWPAEE